MQKAKRGRTLGNLADALKTFQDYLAKDPRQKLPSSLRRASQESTRTIENGMMRLPLMMTSKPSIREPQAVEADYWIGICTQQKGDNEAAAPILDGFAKANPQHALALACTLCQGRRAHRPGKKDEGIAALASVADQFPESQPAPFTYFMRAQLRASEGKANDVVALMREFIEKYPKNDKVYFAYESIAQTSVNSGKTEDAVGTYRVHRALPRQSTGR